MTLHGNWYLDITIGVDATVETRKIQGRGAFLQRTVKKTEIIKKAKVNVCDFPRTMEARMIAIPRKKANTEVLP
jgi:hypothetical protein